MFDAHFYITAGQWLFAIVTIMCWFLAVFESIPTVGKADDDTLSLRSDLKRSAFWGLALLMLQLGALTATYLVDDIKQFRGMALMYVVGACFLPALWASGKVYGTACGIPVVSSDWSRWIKWRVVGGLGGLGAMLTVALLTAVPIVPGEAVKGFGDPSEATIAMGLAALWLMINAPWMEELVFRHYMIPAIARAFNVRRTGLVVGVVVAAALFAVGHAGHMEPAWPKLVQTFGYGLALGWTRIYLGTSYAIGLHMLWNLTSVFIVPFVGEA